MKKFFNKVRELWQDESAQGMTEYILLVVVVVTILIIFKGKIMEIVKGKMEEVGGAIGGFKVEGN